MIFNEMKQIFGFNINSIVFQLIIISSLLSFLSCDRIKDKIYKPIESNYFCFRRLSAFQQIGCNTKESGNVGTVHLIKDEKDFDYVLKSGPNYPYIPVITPKLFKIKYLLQLKASDKISGLLLLDVDRHNKSEDVNALSPDKTCPNNRLGLYPKDSAYGECKKWQWNLADGADSEGIMFTDWPFPIFYVKNDSDINEIKNCFNRYGGPGYPICAIELKAPMNAAKDSITCMRRTALQSSSYSLSQTLFCDPLGGHNVFSTLTNTSKEESLPDNSVIVLSARMDSFSMFDGISPGADSAVTSVVTLLSIAKTLSAVKEKLKEKSINILFAFFDGEAFDYIGSSRAVYDINANQFPLDPKYGKDLAQIGFKHIWYFLELNQLAPHETNGANRHKLWIHKNLKSNQTINALIEKITINAKKTSNLDIEAVDDNNPLPPSSLQSFLKHNQSMPGVVIANHLKAYTNKFYNSLYDDMLNVNNSDVNLSESLANIATVISKSVYELITQEVDEDLIADKGIVKRLLECYLIDSNCDLFKEVFSPDITFHNGPTDPFPTYVGVYNPQVIAPSRRVTRLLLSYFIGDDLKSTSKDECNKLNKESDKFTFDWINSETMNGTCIRSQAVETPALSPAFLNSEDGHISNPDLYSSWTESRWGGGARVRLFLKPSPLQEWLTLITGLIFFILSFIVIYFIDKKSSKLFNNCDDIGPQQTLTINC